MNREDIIRLAIEHTINGLKFDEDGLVRFAQLVAQHEHEACANLRKEVALLGKQSTEYEEGFWEGLEKYEDLIRARG